MENTIAYLSITQPLPELMSNDTLILMHKALLDDDYLNYYWRMLDDELNYRVLELESMEWPY
jgi:hypothetical protein